MGAGGPGPDTPYSNLVHQDLLLSGMLGLSGSRALNSEDLGTKEAAAALAEGIRGVVEGPLVPQLLSACPKAVSGLRYQQAPPTTEAPSPCSWGKLAHRMLNLYEQQKRLLFKSPAIPEGWWRALASAWRSTQ